MSQPTQNASALLFVQEILDFTRDFNSLIARAQLISNQQSVHNYAANIQAMPTYALNADGTAGATDGTPQQGNPITGLNVAFYNIDQARTKLVEDFITFATGSGAAAEADRRTQVNALLP